jgi:phosphoribosylamine--glycine ligase
VEDPAEGHRHDRKRRDLIQDRRQPFLAARGVYRNGFTDKQEEKRMKVLIVGSGGREHAIAWKVAQSKKVDKIYCAPGNAGISEVAECVPIGAMEFDKLVAFAKEKEIDLTVIGMDDPLVGGIVDVFEKEGLRVFGPRKNAAILEGSKAFSKDLMKKYNIPTAAYETFTDPEKALEYLETAKMPIVLKADGLALGKGVLICQTLEEAKEGVKTLMMDKKFGSAGDEIVIEEFMTGREVSVLSFVDGNIVKIMSSAQDHKRAKDGDQGLNTGGMGNFSPSPFYTKEVDEFCKKYIYQPTVDAMKAEGRPFKGVIFFGLMLTPDGPKVLEYNARFGDPEAQVVLPRLENDIVDVFEACIDGTLDQVDLKFDNDRATVCVILASDGYPVEYKKGFPIEGLEKFKGKDDYYVFHSGTKFNENGQIVTNGGRVLGVTATGKDLKEARKKAYEATEWISFENKYMRHDIGKAIDDIHS